MKNRTLHSSDKFGASRFVHLNEEPKPTSFEVPNLKFDTSKLEKTRDDLSKKVEGIVSKTTENLQKAKLEQSRQVHTVQGLKNDIYRVDFKNDKKAEAKTRLKDMFDDEYIQMRIGKENLSHPELRGQMVFAKKGQSGDYYFVGTGERVKTHTGDLVGSHLNEQQLASAQRMEKDVIASKGDLNKILAKNKPELDKWASENRQEDMLAALEPQKDAVITDEEPIVRSATVAARERAAREQEQVATMYPTVDLRDDAVIRAEQEAEEMASLNPGERYAALKGAKRDEQLDSVLAARAQTEKWQADKGAKKAEATEDSYANAIASLEASALDKVNRQMQKPTDAPQRLAKAPEKGKQPPRRMAGGRSQE